MQSNRVEQFKRKITFLRTRLQGESGRDARETQEEIDELERGIKYLLTDINEKA